MNFTMSQDGHPRATIRIERRVGADEVVGALATEGHSAERIRELTKAEAEKMVRRGLERYGDHVYYARDNHSDDEWSRIVHAAVDRFPEIESLARERWPSAFGDDSEGTSN